LTMSLIQSKERDGTVSLHVCGYVTKDPYIPQSGKVVLFSVCYGKDKYMDCKVWADKKAGQLAACLEKHDDVCVDGVLDAYEKDGKTKVQISVDFLTVQQEAPSTPEAEDAAEASASPEGFTELNEEDDGGELPF